MMDCHILEIEDFDSPRLLLFAKTELIVDSRGFFFFICRCKECGKPFLCIGLDSRLSDLHGEWNYWIPLSESEIDEIRLNHDYAADLLESRRHIIWRPDGKIVWNDACQQAPDIGAIINSRRQISMPIAF